jgi:hypothetical protein
MRTSAFLSINWREAVHDLIAASSTVVFSIIKSTLNSVPLNFNWRQTGPATIDAGSIFEEKFFSRTKIVNHANA